jgi:8-oxo-dGTP pyrophosphatase MutT (NUDIX family)
VTPPPAKKNISEASPIGSASERRAESETIPALPAATVMLVRDAPPSGLEVFVLRRTASATFAAGMYVFPGGRVDEADGSAEVEPVCSGLDDDVASKALGVDHGGLAFWVAAVRECFEEAGVLLARRRDGGPVRIDDSERRAVHAGELSIANLCRRHDLVLDLSAIRYVAHWVTPIGEARRFDTRFFLAAAPPGQHGTHDDVELVDSRWVRPADAIALADAGELLMLPPTLANLRTLAESDTVEFALAAADAAGPPPRIQPWLRRDASGRVVGIALPGDPDY